MDQVRAQGLLKELTRPGVKIDGWVVLDLLGHGKSAAVFRASKNDSVAALKVMDAEVVERFGKPSQKKRIELQRALIGSTHPNLVRILDAGECEATGYLYVAMEYLSYQPLSARIEEFPPSHIPALISQIASAARYLEGLGLAHRDIKPENIAVSDDLRHAVLLDLGVLKPTIDCSDNGTGGEFVGTLRYSAPEFALGNYQDDQEAYRAITFYQLGAVLHDLIMRRPLFKEHETPFPRLCEAIRCVQPVIQSRDIAPEIQSLARHCLSKSAAARLKLVTWERFESLGCSEDASEVKEQLRRKLLEREFEVGGLHQESARVNIGEVADMVRGVVRNTCVSSPLIPPVVVTSGTSFAETFFVEVAMGPSAERGLAGELVIRLNGQFSVDEQVLTISGYALLRPTGAVSPSDGVESFKSVTTVNSEEIRAPLDGFVHRALLSALQVAEPVVQVTWLKT